MKRLALVLVATFSIGLWASPSGAQTVVTPGAFCTPLGATGVTSAGTAMVCSQLASAPMDQARWRDASTPGLLTVLPGIDTSTSTTGVTTTTTIAAVAGAVCNSAYTGTCLPVDTSVDVDCVGGTGNGPLFVQETNFTVVDAAVDPFDLDRDNDGIACESTADLAGTTATTAPATTIATTTGTGTGSNLARTGSDSITPFAGAGLALVLLGLASAYAARRTRSEKALAAYELEQRQLSAFRRP